MPMVGNVLEIDGLDLGYDGKIVVPGFTLSVAEGEFVSLLGPSGCGKTTILRALAGFLPAMSGSIRLMGRDITRLPPEARDIGIVFQNYALFPTMSAFENIAFGLRVARRPRAEIEVKVRAIAETSGIAAHLDKTPASLSGGQQQRVAIARALVMGSRVLLFDEPLSNLDAKVRLTMRAEIKRLQRELGFTAIFVTHDQEEALSMSDRIVVLNGGATEQIGRPRDLYAHPATPFIATFIGASNELPPALAEQMADAPRGRCFVRHEDVILGSEGVPATVEHVEFLGPISRIDCRVGDALLSSVVPGGVFPEIGSETRLCLRPGAVHVFAEGRV